MVDLDLAAVSDRGPAREVASDAALVLPRCGVVLVEQDGKSAADALVARQYAETVRESVSALIHPEMRVELASELLLEALRSASRRLPEGTSSGPVRAAGVLVSSAYTVVVSLGHVRCYRLRASRLELLTGDTQSPAGSSKHLEPMPEVSISPSVAGDILLAASGGVWGTLGERTISGILAGTKTAHQTCDALLGACWVAGGLDSRSAAVIRLVSLELRAERPQSSVEHSRLSAPPPGEAEATKLKCEAPCCPACESSSEP